MQNFIKVGENKYGAIYERENTEFKFVHRIDLMHKKSGFHIVQSYDPALGDEKGLGNTGVGLTMYEMKLCLKKMKQMGWKPCKRNGR